MNKLITKIVGAALGLTMTVGVGVSIGVASNNTTIIPANAASQQWELVTSAPSDWSGEYILCNGTSGTVKYLQGSTFSSSSASGVDVTVSSSKITVDDSNALTIAKSSTSGKYTVKVNDKYIGKNANSNGIDANATWSSNLDNTISYSSNKVVIAGNGGRVLTWYASNSNFRYYASSNNNSQLFKKVTQTDTYTVSFNANGGTGTMSDVTGVYGSYELPSCTFTAPSGYAFAGWKANNAGSLLAVGDSYTVNAAVTFYAQWADQRTVTYNSNGGSGTMTDPNSPYGDGATVTVLANAFTAPEGQRFSHWNTASDDSGTDYYADDTFTINANTTLYAIWEIAPDEVNIEYSSYSDNLPASGYSAVDWESGGVSGKIYTIKNTNSAIQFQANTSYIYNSLAITGYIKKITVSKYSGSYTKLTAFVGSSAITEKPETGGTDNNTDWVWTFDPNDHYAYFRIDSTSTGAKYFSSIVVEYDKVSTVDPTGITLNNSSPISMDTYGYGRRTLEATVEPFNANDKTVTWGTNNSAVATISDGVLTPTGVGSTTVYACTSNYDPEDPNPDLIKTVSVTVTQAEYKKATFVPTSTSSATQEDDYLSGGSVTVSAENAGTFNTDKQAIQLSGGKDSTFTITGYEGMKITGIDLVMSSNGSAGTGSLTVTIGTTGVLEISTAPFSDPTWNGAFDANPCHLFKDSTDYVVEASEDIVFSFGATVNSLYIHSVSIRYLDYSLEQWCQDFLDNYSCDSTGTTAPSTSDWDDFGLEFLGLDSDLQLIAKNATADEEGTVIEQAMAKYDYVISKYGDLEDEHGAKLYDNFIERTVQPLHSTRVNGTINSTAATIVLAVISTISLTAVGGYFFLRKKKEQ